MKTQHIIIVLIGLIAIACEGIELRVADTDVPVIESYITPGDSLAILISEQIVFSTGDTNTYYIDSLEVEVWEGSEWVTLTNTDSGMYIATGLNITAGDTLQMQFDYNDNVVSASTIIPLKPVDFDADNRTIEAYEFSRGSRPDEDDPITVSWSNPDEEYFMIVVECIAANPTLIDDDDEDDRPPRSFRSSPTQGTEKEISAMEFTYYGYHNIILYKLNTEYAALYEQLSSSSIDMAAPPSNVVNGLGIFTGINADTVRIKVY